LLAALLLVSGCSGSDSIKTSSKTKILPAESRQGQVSDGALPDVPAAENAKNSNTEKGATPVTPAAPIKEADTAEPSIVLTINGPGVNQETHYTLADLKAMREGYTEQHYSAVNNMPMQRFFVGKGINLLYLLQKAGLKPDAKAITVKASDNYRKRFTLKQLSEPLYYYPNLLNNSSEGAQIVPPILAWEHKEGSNDLAAAESGQLRLLLGQKTIEDISASQLVKYVNQIEVSAN